MNTRLGSFNVVVVPIPNFLFNSMKTINTAVIITRRCMLVLQTLVVRRTLARIRIRQQTRLIHRK